MLFVEEKKQKHIHVQQKPRFSGLFHVSKTGTVFALYISEFPTIHNNINKIEKEKEKCQKSQ